MKTEPLASADHVALARAARRAQAIYVGACIAAALAAVTQAAVNAGKRGLAVFQKERGKPSTCSAT